MFLQNVNPNDLLRNRPISEVPIENPGEDAIFPYGNELRKPFPDLLGTTNAKRSMTEPLNDSRNAIPETGQVSSTRTRDHMNNNLGPESEIETQKTQIIESIDSGHPKSHGPEMTNYSLSNAMEPIGEDVTDTNPHDSSSSTTALYKRKSWPPNAENALTLTEPLGPRKNSLESRSHQEKSRTSLPLDRTSQVPNVGSTSTSPDDSDLLMNLDLTGKETWPKSVHHVSSKDRHRYKKIFLELSDEEVIDVIPCSLERELLIHGQIYLTSNHLCFHGKIARKYVRVGDGD